MLSCYSHPTLIRTSAWLSFRISDLRRSRTCWWCPGTVGGKVIFMRGGYRNTLYPGENPAPITFLTHRQHIANTDSLDHGDLPLGGSDESFSVVHRQ